MSEKAKNKQEVITELGVLPGYRCNFNCHHCSIGYKRSATLSAAEMELIAETIRMNAITALIVAGGEPSLHIPVINRLFEIIAKPEDLFVTITTNGSFAKDAASAEEVLGKFSFLNKIQLSYDKWHAKYLPFENIRHLCTACKRRGVEFNVSMAIESPTDLVEIAKLRAIADFQVNVQKVISAGHAERFGIGYKFPTFESEVLTRRCPNLKKPVYLCGRGFALCDINLSFKALAGTAQQKIFKSLSGLVSSDFYLRMQGHTFGELLAKYKIDKTKLLPAHSLPCNLCAYIGTQLLPRS